MYKKKRITLPRIHAVPIVLAMAMIATLGGALLVGTVSAVDCKSNQAETGGSCVTCPAGQVGKHDQCVPGCGGVATNIVRCNQNDDSKDDLKSNGIWATLLLVLNILTAGVGVVAVSGLIWAGLLYTSARDNAPQVSKAKALIFSVVLGIVAYAGIYALLQWLIPGGVFG